MRKKQISKKLILSITSKGNTDGCAIVKFRIRRQSLLEKRMGDNLLEKSSGNLCLQVEYRMLL